MNKGNIITVLLIGIGLGIGIGFCLGKDGKEEQSDERKELASKGSGRRLSQKREKKCKWREDCACSIVKENKILRLSALMYADVQVQKKPPCFTGVLQSSTCEGCTNHATH